MENLAVNNYNIMTMIIFKTYEKGRLSLGCICAVHVHGSVLRVLRGTFVENGVPRKGGLAWGGAADGPTVPGHRVWDMFHSQFFHLGQEVLGRCALHHHDRNFALVVRGLPPARIFGVLPRPKKARLRESGADQSDSATNSRAAVVYEFSCFDVDGWDFAFRSGLY